jgi:hypothetical protein
MATNSNLQDMNFKVNPEFHRLFRFASALNGMSMKELLDASFRAWINRCGADALKELLPKAWASVGGQIYWRSRVL